jgi:endonuclease YncB( thermonuclease family)
MLTASALRIFLSSFLILFFASTALATTFSGKVVKVTDGDTLQIMWNGKAEKIRLAGIDCPEKSGQAFGTAATRYALELAAQQVVLVRVASRDRYGRMVGEIILPDGRSLNQELVRAGYAWWYRKYSTDRTLADLEDEARRNRRGLWSDPNPVPPWEWRKEKKS